MIWGRGVAAGLCGLVVLGTLPAGGRPFTAAVVLWGAAALLELTVLLATAGYRPLVPGAAVGALGVGLVVLAGGHPSWERVPMVMALMVLAAFVVALVSPRKRHITVAMAATVLPALVVGLGTAGVLVLRPASAGFRWTLGLLLVTVMPAALAAVAGRLTGGGALDTPVRVVTAGAVGGALLFGLNPPFTALSAVGLTGIGLAAGWATLALATALPARDSRVRASRPSLALTLLTAPLVAAPAAAFLALATQA